MLKLGRNLTSISQYHLSSLSMKIATWTRDSHGLFDYESQQIFKKSFSTHQVRHIIRTSDGDVKLVNDKELAASGPDAAVLFKIIPKTDSKGTSTYIIQNCSKTDIYSEANDKLWLIIRSLKKNDVKEVLLNLFMI